MKNRNNAIGKELEPKPPRCFSTINFIIPPLIGLVGSLSMILISQLLSKGSLPVIGFTSFSQLNFLLSMQLFILPISFVALGLVYLLYKENFRLFFRKGNVIAASEAIRLIGFRKARNWQTLGPAILILGAAATITFTTIAVIQMKGVVNVKVIALFPLALLMALTNSWAEEIFNRFAIVAGLRDRIKPLAIYWISAAVFGIPHYFGTPGGVTGIVLTGILGWFLAKSVFETKGLFWALLIHFVLDVLIFTSQIMIMVGSS